ncbi:MAG: alpha/beta hydrolase [Chloroflexi bacterium]|nr:alpha/beta hydrolase [Chloroflexota bacterium]
MQQAVTQWEIYTHTVQHPPTISGRVRILRGAYSPQLDVQRDVIVYLPPSYHDADTRYPVVYMQDGQNLFDAGTAFGGQEWHVDETMEQLATEGIEAIIVAPYHGGEKRIQEYNPFPHVWRGKGQLYLDWLRDTLKPLIDRDFRTLPEREHTGILGSSMGGLISMYAFFHRSETFGFAGVMSPAFWIGSGAIYASLQDAPYVDGKIYLDNGTRETSARRMNALLIKKGYNPCGNLLYVVEQDAEHTESAWARRMPDALRFLLGK